MIHASTLLKALPSLPTHARETLALLVAKAGDPEIHIPGMPSLPSIPGDLPIPKAVQDAILAVLGRFDFTFYQVFGVQVSLDGKRLGGMGGKVSETLNLKNPVPAIRVTPVFELGDVAFDPPGLPGKPTLTLP